MNLNNSNTCDIQLLLLLLCGWSVVCIQNLATVKSFNICLEFEDTQEVFVNLYKLFFGIVK